MEIIFFIMISLAIFSIYPILLLGRRFKRGCTGLISVGLVAAISVPLLLLPLRASSVDFICDSTPVDNDGEVEDLPVDADFSLDAKSAVLMEESTGKILYELNSEEALPPASVTKIMTLLLAMEALDNGSVNLTDMVTVSAYASSMGGSQVFLEEGERMSFEDILKCTVIASANDAAVAIAEHLMGSEAAFVARMNERAGELGLSTARFENATGLDDDTKEHVMSAKDIAVISRELISHKKILEYSSVWMDTIRDGAFTLTNTNRLVRYYDGATGLKTGSTDKAKFCVTVTAEKNGMSLIAVIMGAPSRDIRNACAKTLLDWGFANFTVYSDVASDCGKVPVLCGTVDVVSTRSDAFSIVLSKAKAKNVRKNISLSGAVQAPIAKGSVIGTVTYLYGDEVIGCVDIKAAFMVEKLTYGGLIGRMFKIFFLS